MVHGCVVYIVGYGPRRNGARPGYVSVASSPSRSASVYSGLMSMPSGECHVDVGVPSCRAAAPAEGSPERGWAWPPSEERARLVATGAPPPASLRGASPDGSSGRSAKDSGMLIGPAPRGFG